VAADSEWVLELNFNALHRKHTESTETDSEAGESVELKLLYCESSGPTLGLIKLS
jgi:hypothetical protein